MCIFLVSCWFNSAYMGTNWFEHSILVHHLLRLEQVDLFSCISFSLFPSKSSQVHPHSKRKPAFSGDSISQFKSHNMEVVSMFHKAVLMHRLWTRVQTFVTKVLSINCISQGKILWTKVDLTFIIKSFNRLTFQVNFLKSFKQIHF